MLVDLTLAPNAGNLVYLGHRGDRLEGRFTSHWASFMSLRPPRPTPHPPRAARADRTRRTRRTGAPPTPWNDTTAAWLLAQLRLPRDILPGYELDPDTRRPVASTLVAPDGSWARIDHRDATDTEAGPTELWSHVEQAHAQWEALGRPSWERFGLTVTATGAHPLWLDDPRDPAGQLPTA